MKIRVLGFSWVPEFIPKAAPAILAFEQMQRNAGQEIGRYSVAAMKDGEWWTGFLLKIRDSRAFTKQRLENGTVVFGAERLEDGEKLAEGNFFVAHESNGHGLYCYHHMSASLLGDFGYVAGRMFSVAVKNLRDALVKEHGPSSKETKAGKKALAGKLIIAQTLRPGTFNDYVRKLKEIYTLEANLVSFEMKKKTFVTFNKFARRKKISLSFDSNAPMGQIANAIADLNSNHEFENATVSGKDQYGYDQTYKLAKDAQVFDEWDYDEMVVSGDIRFNDIPGSIAASPIIAKLKDAISQPNTRKMLGIP
jgi:hypothetical protein